MDPWLYLIAMKDSAKELGVKFLEAVPLDFKYQKIKTDRAKMINGFSNEERVLSDIVVRINSAARGICTS